MRVIDLTHPITQDMPVYPGTERPRLEAVSTYEADGFRESRLSITTHTGTHMDPPAHILPGRTTLDRFPVSRFVGTAVVIDCTDLGEGDRITLDHIRRRGVLAEQAEFLLFRTGWDRYWGTPRYFSGYPCMDGGAADYLLRREKKGVGLDTISLDPVDDGALTLHNLLFRNHEVVAVENLTHLDQAGEGLFTFCALPLSHRDADGSPVRAVAIFDD